MAKYHKKCKKPDIIFSIYFINLKRKINTYSNNDLL